MKIALLTDGIYPYVMGGMQKHSYYLAKYLAKNKIQVDLFHFNQSLLNIEELGVFEEEEKKYINSIVLEFPKLSTLPGHYVKESYRYSEIIFEKIKPNLHQYDFIYTKGFTGWKLIESKMNGLSCPRIGVNFHGYEMFQPAPSFKVKLQHLILRKPVKWISKHADVVFSYGGKITEIIASLGIKHQKIIEIPTGIQESWINKNKLVVNKPKRFIFIGRYERRKGIEELNTVLKELLKTDNFIFEFIGNIPLIRQLKSKKLIYHGEMRNAEQIKVILQKADVLVCPSHSEGMPNVIMEGMASGLAIIATDVGAVAKMVNNKNGRLINATNLKDNLSFALMEMISITDEELLSYKQTSIDNVNLLFLWDNVIKNVISSSVNDKASNN
ncbi:MAG: glycosyltransferase family 4 protein [Bacteroidia bacterium]